MRMIAVHLCEGLPEGLAHRKNLIGVASLLLLFHLATVTPDTILFYFFIFLFFSFIFISWRLITLQYCSGFCHTLT